MQSTSISKNNLRELQLLISKMPLQDCTLVTSDFGLRWSEISRAVRRARLPMTPTSVASILKKYASKTLDNEEITDIVTRVRLKTIAVRPRTWHVITLMDQIQDQPVNLIAESLPARVAAALRERGNRKAEVQAVKLGDLVFMSAQVVSGAKPGAVLFLASPPGQDVALVSTMSSNLLTACVQGLGYNGYEDACLSGRDIQSLLRVHDRGTTAAGVSETPEYCDAPRVTRGGIDFTNAPATREYLARAYGPDPAVLETLKVKSEMGFFDPQLLNKKIKVTLDIKSDNVFNTLRGLAETGALAPTSELFNVFHSIKSNQIHITHDE